MNYFDWMEEKIEIYEIFKGEIMYKRIFGKKLGFISMKIESKEVELRIQDTIKIKNMRIGDIIQVKGNYNEKDKKEIDLIDVIDIEIFEKNDKIDINELRKYKDEKKEIKSLCKNLKNKGKCENEKCEYRHEYIKGEKERFEKLKEIQKIMYFKSHENDPLENKFLKSKRNELVAQFIVETFGIENLKKGPILDIAGGKGLVSFYLLKNYNLNSIIIDPRGTKLPKKEMKYLTDNKLNIKEIRKEFKEDIKEIQDASLIFGLHPDQASDSIINISMKYSKNFAIIPCCVFPNLFERVLKNEKKVIDYLDYIEWLKENIKDYKLKYLNFQGRNQVIYKIYS